MVNTPEGKFNTYQDAINFCKALLNLADLEVDRARECESILQGLGNTNITIKTDDGECHIHSCRTDDDALAAVEHIRCAIEAIRNRRMSSATNIIDRVKKCHKVISEEMK